MHEEEQLNTELQHSHEEDQDEHACFAQHMIHDSNEWNDGQNDRERKANDI